jgi:2-(1,2-epoxy-1,2-dihydrophenyl)acetyl-CoA isomerase
MAYQQITFERSEGVGTVTLNRPDQLNAFTPQMLAELQDVFKGMVRDPEVRAIVITGAGKAFCAGEDFKSRATAEVPANPPSTTLNPLDPNNNNPPPVPYQPVIANPTLGTAPVEVSTSNYTPSFTNNAPLQPQTISGNTPALTPPFTEQVQRSYNLLIRQIRQIEKPVIAAVNGTAAGLGLGLALACDIRYASERARFLEVAVRVGLIPGGGNAFFLPRLIGLSKALELAFTGDELGASEAEKIGLVSRVVLADQLVIEARQLALRLAKGPTRAMGLSKALIYNSVNLNLNQALDFEAQLMDEVLHSADYKEGLNAFVQKRPPEYKGR